MHRPTVSVYNCKEDSKKVEREIKAPHVFATPLRQDLVSFVHDQLSKNTRQAHGVNRLAGLRHSAESWGTGRAVARIPRIKGSGTHRSGQGAFGNMCRKGRMSFPLHTWRRWHRKVNLRQKRHALASAVAASAVTSLVQAKGHRISKIPQLPLVLDNTFTEISKTKDAVTVLKRFGLYEDIERVIGSKKVRPGKAKVRGGRFRQRKGPLVIINEESTTLIRALRNIPGVDTVNVKALNIRLLAPGGQLGRLCVYTESAFKQLASEFGSYKGASVNKRGYILKRNIITNPDISSIINSDVIQSVVKQAKTQRRQHCRQKKNPLKNKATMETLNPYQKEIRAIKHKKIKKNKKNTKDLKTKAIKFISDIEAKVDEKINEDGDIYRKNIDATKQ